MRKLGSVLLTVVLAGGAAMPLAAQNDRYDRRNNQSSQYNDGLHRGYNGRNGGYNDQYDQRRYNSQNDRGRYGSQDEYNRTHGGIGPGKGAAIGGAGGAVLGALFGGGMKGAIIGGAAGAGVGAVAGKVHQDNKQNDWRDYRDGRR